MQQSEMNRQVLDLPRDGKGRFIKGVCYNLSTQFQKGQHWRKPQPYWNKKWLENEYVNNRKSASDIAKEQSCKENNILYFLNKHKIKTRTISESRQIKFWGLFGSQNPMYGKTGKLNPNWNGGHSPERQSMYARAMWKEIKKLVLKRDNYQCQECPSHQSLEVHHIKPWSRYPQLRFEQDNLITLCVACHKQKHAKGR